jgi:hypothetical protein
MTWRDQILGSLAEAVPCGYERTEPTAAEPTALAAMALAAAGRADDAARAIAGLTRLQQADGSVAPADGLSSPGWPTSLAILADVAVHGNGSDADNGSVGFIEGTGARANRPGQQAKRFSTEFNRPRAVEWLLEAKGESLKVSALMGHDAMLVGWPWAEGTHSWVEPTAFAVIALKAVGLGDHERTREAVRLLRDRLFASGGCNYGNTVVLRQKLRPHLLPTALALLALWQEQDTDGRIGRSIDYLAASLAADTPVMSLTYGVIALRRHGREVQRFKAALKRAYERVVERGASPYKMALLSLAAGGGNGST